MTLLIASMPSPADHPMTQMADDDDKLGTLFVVIKCTTRDMLHWRVIEFSDDAIVIARLYSSDDMNTIGMTWISQAARQRDQNRSTKRH